MTRIKRSRRSGMNLGILDAEPARFEVGEHRLDAPAPAVIQGRKVPRLVGHGDDPRFGVTGIMNNPDMGPGAPGGEFDIFLVEAFAAGTGFQVVVLVSPSREPPDCL